MSEFIYHSKGAPMRDASGNVSLARERVVRCKDCRYYEDTGNCTWFECSACWLLAEVTPGGFCAWGEKAVEDESNED